MSETTTPTPPLATEPGLAQERLLAERDCLRAALAAASHALNDTGENWQLGDAAVDDSTRDGASSRAEALQRQLRGVNEAIARLTDGTYGLCEDCGDEIGSKRLEFDPSVALCRDCQGEREGVLRSRTL